MNERDLRLQCVTMAAQLTNDRAVVRSVLKRVDLRFDDLLKRILIGLDLSTVNGVDPHRFRCEQEEAHRRQKDQFDDDHVAPVPGARAKERDHEGCQGETNEDV